MNQVKFKLHSLNPLSRSFLEQEVGWGFMYTAGNSESS